MKSNVPIWLKYNLTIEEAASYFHIGEARLRQLVSENPNARYVLRNGKKVLIKRKLFEEYVDSAYAV